MSWRQHLSNSTRPPQHVLEPTGTCLGNNTRQPPQHVLGGLLSMPWHEQQHVLASTACLGNSTRRPPHVLAQTPACLHQHVLATAPGGLPSMSWHQPFARTPACLDFNTSMPWQQQLACPGKPGGLPSMSWRQHQHVLATAPGGLPSMSWHKHQHVLARTPASRTPACLGVNTSMSSWHKHQHVPARMPTCLGVNTMSWQQHQAASPACLGTNSSMSWRQQHVLGTAPGGLPMSWHKHQHVFTSMSWQQHQAASPACLGTNPWHEHQHVLTSTPACRGNSRRRMSWHEH